MSRIQKPMVVQSATDFHTQLGLRRLAKRSLISRLQTIMRILPTFTPAERATYFPEKFISIMVLTERINSWKTLADAIEKHRQNIDFNSNAGRIWVEEHDLIDALLCTIRLNPRASFTIDEIIAINGAVQGLRPAIPSGRIV